MWNHPRAFDGSLDDGDDEGSQRVVWSGNVMM